MRGEAGDLFAPELLVLLDGVESIAERLPRQGEVCLVHPGQLVQPTNTAEVVLQLGWVLQVPQHLVDHPHQADLAVYHFPPGQVVHTELLVKLIELLDILSELERFTGNNLGF